MTNELYKKAKKNLKGRTKLQLIKIIINLSSEIDKLKKVQNEEKKD